jgi:hypothetical protein
MTLSALGIFSAAGANGFSSDYELIATAFGTGSSGTITFSSIPQDYKHIQLRWTAKNSGTSGSSNNWVMTMNGATGSVYARHFLRGEASGVTSSNSVSQTSILFQDAAALNTVAGVVAAGVADILDYSSSTKNTTVRALYGRAENQIYLKSGLYNATTAVSSLTLTTSAGNFTTVSRFSLYGIKG